MGNLADQIYHYPYTKAIIILTGIVVFLISYMYIKFNNIGGYKRRVLKLSSYLCLIIVIQQIYNSKILSSKFKIDDIYSLYKFILIITLVILCLYILIKLLYKNKHNHYIEKELVSVFIKIIYIVMFISAFYNLNSVITSCIWCCNMINIHFILENLPITKDNHKLYDTLYDERKQLVGYIEYLISINNSDDEYGIALNGSWGSGKTTLLNVLIERKEINKNEYIYIRPLVNDNIESLINEFFKSMKYIFYNNDIYLGINNSIDEYLKYITDFLNINKKSILNIILSHLNEKEKKDYRSLKLDLEYDIHELKKRGKQIVVIIDDFDRIEIEKQKLILGFVKEIAGFKGVTVIFALDYSNIIRSEDNELIEYLEKFIKYDIQVQQQELNKLIKIHKDFYLDESNFKNEISKKISIEINTNIESYIEEILENIEKNIKKLEKKGSKSTEEGYIINKFKTSYKNTINSPRRIIHMLDYIKNILINIDMYNMYNYYTEKLNDINIWESICSMAYINTFHKKNFSEIARNGDIFNYKSNLEVTNLDDKCVESILCSLNLKESSGKNTENKESFKTRFINECIINSVFNNESLELLTEKENILKSIENNNIDLYPDFKLKLKKYYKNILSNRENIEINIDKVYQTVIDLHKQQKIEFKDLVESILPRYIAPNVLRYSTKILMYIKYLIERDEYTNFSQKDNNDIVDILKYIDKDLIFAYKEDIVRAIKICSIDNKSINTDIIRNIVRCEKIDYISSEISKIFNINKSDSDIKNLGYWVNQILSNKELQVDSIIEYKKQTVKSMNQFIEIYKLIMYIRDNLQVKLPETQYYTNIYAGFENLNEEEVLQLIDKIKLDIQNKNNEKIFDHIFRAFHFIIIYIIDLNLEYLYKIKIDDL